MHIYHSLLDIIPYFVVAGIAMALFGLAVATIAATLDASAQQQWQPDNRPPQDLSFPSISTRQPITDQEEEARIQKELAKERERLRRLKEQGS